MIAAPLRADPRILVVGAVRGLPSEVDPLLRALGEFDPGAVAVTLSTEEATTLRTHFVGTPTEPIVPLSNAEAAQAVGLARLAEVRLPAPALLAAIDWAASRGRPAVGVDPSEDAYAELFASSIGYVELVRRTLRERQLVKRPPDASTADEYALAWDRTMAPGAGSQRLVRERDACAAARVRELRAAHGSVALVADRERYESVRARLAEAGH